MPFKAYHQFSFHLLLLTLWAQVWFLPSHLKPVFHFTPGFWHSTNMCATVSRFMKAISRIFDHLTPASFAYKGGGCGWLICWILNAKSAWNPATLMAPCSKGHQRELNAHNCLQCRCQSLMVTSWSSSRPGHSSCALASTMSESASLWWLPQSTLILVILW